MLPHTPNELVMMPIYDKCRGSARQPSLLLGASRRAELSLAALTQGPPVLLERLPGWPAYTAPLESGTTFKT